MVESTSARLWKRKHADVLMLCLQKTTKARLLPINSQVNGRSNEDKLIIIIIIIVTSFAPISSKIKLSGATKPGD